MTRVCSNTPTSTDVCLNNIDMEIPNQDGSIELCVCNIPYRVMEVIAALKRGDSIKRKTATQIVTLHPTDLRALLGLVLRGNFTEASIWQLSTDIKSLRKVEHGRGR